MCCFPLIISKSYHKNMNNIVLSFMVSFDKQFKDKDLPRSQGNNSRLIQFPIEIQRYHAIILKY